jgi:hypothetical protein|tara:strand:- start:3999 stop:4232 length:234 start_codon:yes stop_codon:yes gene_type:complete
MGSVRDKIIQQIRAAKKNIVEVVETVKVRARTEEGHFVKDDPKTPENEAWVEKPKSEVKAKPKAKAKLKVKKTTKKK